MCIIIYFILVQSYSCLWKSALSIFRTIVAILYCILHLKSWDTVLNLFLVFLLICWPVVMQHGSDIDCAVLSCLQGRLQQARLFIHSIVFCKCYCFTEQNDLTVFQESISIWVLISHNFLPPYCHPMCMCWFPLKFCLVNLMSKINEMWHFGYFIGWWRMLSKVDVVTSFIMAACLLNLHALLENDPKPKVSSHGIRWGVTFKV